MKWSAFSKALRWAFVASPLIFPLYLVRFSLSGIPITLAEIVSYGLFGAWALQVAHGHERLNLDFRTKIVYVAAGLIAIGATMGVLAAPSFIELPSGMMLDATRTALGAWKGWVVAPMLYFLALSHMVRAHNLGEKTLRMFGVSAGLVSLAAYGWMLFGNGLTDDLRLRGFFESPNHLALFIVPAALLGVWFFVKQSKNAVWNALNTISFVVALSALWLTQSYGGMLGFLGALALAVGVWILRRREWKKALAAATTLLIMGGGLIALLWHTPKFRQMLDTVGRSSSSVRLEVYEVSGHLIAAHPFMGVGPGLFQAFYQTEGREKLGHVPMEWNMPHPHNIFLAFWLNAGLLGLLGLMLIVISAHTRWSYALIPFWGLLIHGLVDTPFWKNDLAMIFWLLMASILASCHRSELSSSDP